MIKEAIFTESQPVHLSRAERRARREAGIEVEELEVTVTEWTVEGQIEQIIPGVLVVYVIDGTPVRVPGGFKNAQHIPVPVHVGESVRVVTRARDADGMLSANAIDSWVRA